MGRNALFAQFLLGIAILLASSTPGWARSVLQFDVALSACKTGSIAIDAYVAPNPSPIRALSSKRITYSDSVSFNVESGRATSRAHYAALTPMPKSRTKLAHFSSKTFFVAADSSRYDSKYAGFVYSSGGSSTRNSPAWQTHSSFSKAARIGPVRYF